MPPTSLRSKGATFTSPEEIAAACRVVFLCLPGPKQVTELLGPEGLANRLATGSVVVDITSSTPAVDVEVAADQSQMMFEWYEK